MPPKKEIELHEAEVQHVVARRRPAENPEDREQQMINYADALAEKQLREGTASAQVITHYLKLGTSRERLEQEKIHNENLRLQAQVAQIQSQARTEQLMEEVISALRIYTGVDDDEE